MVWLACHPEGPLTTRQIADATQVPAGYLAKVLQPLGRANLVHSRRGLNGGFILAKPAEQISVLEVIHAVEPAQHRDDTADAAQTPDESPQSGGGSGGGSALPNLDERLHSVVMSIETSLDRCSIADLVAHGIIEKSAPPPPPTDETDPQL